jgi:ABC-type phosphate transport system substrate-binding protein
VAIPLVLACLAGMSFGCAPATPTPAPAAFTVLVTPDLAALAGGLVAAFQRVQPAARVTVQTVSPRQLPAALQQNAGSIAVSYPLAAASGISETVLALDGIAVTVAFTNSVENLTTAQVRLVFAGQAAYWNEAGGGPEAIVTLYRDEAAPSRPL